MRLESPLRASERESERGEREREGERARASERRESERARASDAHNAAACTACIGAIQSRARQVTVCRESRSGTHSSRAPTGSDPLWVRVRGSQ